MDINNNNSNYHISIIQGSTGFTNSWYCKNAKETRKSIEEYRKNYTTHVRVWSDKHDDFVYYKRSLQYDCDIQKEEKRLFHRDYDLRNKLI